MMDIEMTDADDMTPMRTLKKRKFVIGVDYGTTFSAVSYTILDPESSLRDNVHPKLFNIRGFPGDPQYFLSTAQQVPTEIWYLEKRHTKRHRPSRAAEIKDPAQSYHPNQFMDLSSDEDNEVHNESITNRYQANKSTLPAVNAYWGYEVQKALGEPNSGADPKDVKNYFVSRAKLLLDESDTTKSARESLSETLKFLKRKKLIQKDEDVITDFLTYLLSHVKKELEERHSFDDDCDVEFAICVPPVWTYKASVIMTRALSTAAHKAGFRTSHNGTIDDLFIVSEPEAAATYFLDQDGWDKRIQVSHLHCNSPFSNRCRITTHLFSLMPVEEQ
jgi:molecular chaperone DnaK (HSP70)